MKKQYFILMITVLLSLTAGAAKRPGTVPLSLLYPDGSFVMLNAVAVFDDVAHTATLGNGYNACITHYEKGILTIPGSYINGTDTFTVEIGPMAFRFCNNLTDVIISEGVKSIGAYAFIGCSSVKTMRLPSTLETIGSGAFCEMASLTSIRSNAPTSPTWEWNDVFTSLGTQASMSAVRGPRTLYIPRTAYDNYLQYKFDGSQTPAGDNVGWADAFRRIYQFSTEPQTIGSLEELIAFRDAVNSGQPYKNNPDHSVILTADIDMSSVSNWTPIGTGEKPFCGTFNGNGHVIKNLTIKSSDPYIGICGLFGITNNASIYHFYMLNPSVIKTHHAAAVAAIANNTHIVDVLVTSDIGGSQFTLDGIYAGGIAGETYGSTIERCMFRGRIYGAIGAGGITSIAYYNTTINDCKADHYIENKETSVVGGIVCGATQVTINRCLAINEFNSATVKGAIAGVIYNDDQSSFPMLTSVISNCAYWNKGGAIKVVGRAIDTQHTTVVENGNKGFGTENSMLADSTRTPLGNSWHYFCDEYLDYPVPETLLEMYQHNVQWGTDADGLVYIPYGSAGNISAYAVIGYNGNATTLAIPDTYNGKPVVSICNEALKGNRTVADLTVGNNVVSIGDSTFYRTAIKTLTLGNRLKTIGACAFAECDSLLQVELPDSVTTLGHDAFVGCDNLRSFGVSVSFKEHDGNFLSRCYNLNDLHLNGTNHDGYICKDNVLIHNFYNGTSYYIACSPAKTGNYIMPTFEGFDRVNVLGECFAGCTGLTGITFPTDASCWIGPRAFDGATNLRYIDLSLANKIRAEGEAYTEGSITVNRLEYDNPFYGTSNSTLIYLYGQHQAAEGQPNVVMIDPSRLKATAHHMLLTEDWDFYKPRFFGDIHVDHGVSYDRVLTSTIKEKTRKTGNKIIITNDETGAEIEIDEVEVIGYEYVPTYYSVCLPYNLTLTSENAKVYRPQQIQPDWAGDPQKAVVTFTEVEDKKMMSYLPYYVVISGEDEVSLNTTEEVTIGNGNVRPWSNSGFECKGTVTTISNADMCQADKPYYILQSDGNWHRVAPDTEEAYVPPYRGYFQATESNNTALQLITLLGKQGDVNQDGQVTIADVTALIDIMLRSQSDYVSVIVDINLDGQVDLADVTALIDYLLSGHWN